MEAFVTQPVDRRAARRRRGEEHGIVAVRIRPGHPARVVDVSAAGALLETPYRLLPGAAVDLHMKTDHQHISIRGQVVRCAVARLHSAAVFYRGAVAFDRRLSWFADGHEYRLPMSDSSQDALAREGATHDPL
jgi:PilZ domain-containing protein